MLNLLILVFAYSGSVALAHQILKPYINRYYETWQDGWSWRYSPLAWTVFAVTRGSYSRGESRQEVAIWIVAVIWPLTLVLELLGQVTLRPFRKRFVNYDSPLNKFWLFRIG